MDLALTKGSISVRNASFLFKPENRTGSLYDRECINGAVVLIG